MSDLLNSASLVMIPSGYAEDKVYSVVPSDGSGDMTLTRASNGSRVNSAGLVEVCPWNLAGYSEQFDNSAWVKTTDGQVTITANATTAPNGTTTADKMIASAIAGFHCVAQTQSLVAGVFTISIYAKAGEYSFLQIFDSLTTDFANFNLTTGAVATVDQYTATIESVGNGWYRCTATKTNPSGNFVFRYGIVTTGTATRGESFTGNGVNGLFIWGAQLNIGSTAKPYFPTTDRLNVPRLTYQNGGGGCPSLLLEKQSTNLVFPSEDITAWSTGGMTNTANQTTSPDGTQNADKSTIGSTTRYYDAVSGVATTVGGTTYTTSFFAKKGTGIEAIYFYQGDGGAKIAKWNLNNGAYIGYAPADGYGAFTSQTSESLGNGWYRFSATYTASGTSGNYVIGVSTNTNDSVNTISGNGTDFVYIWGLQYEASSYPTSYIPTTSSSATRVADACYKTGISSLIGQTEGTLFCQYNLPYTTNDTRIIAISGGSDRVAIFCDYTSIGFLVVTSAGLVILESTTYTAQASNKVALAYKSGLCSLYLNGTQILSSATTFSLSATIANLYLGQYEFSPGTGQNGLRVQESVIFKTRLTNAQLASLTTI